MKRFVILTAAFLATPAWAGLRGDYYSGYVLDSNGIIQVEGLTPILTREDAQIDFWNGSSSHRIAGISNGNFTVEWTGGLWIEAAGEYGFGTISDDGSQVWVDGQLVVNNGESQWYDWEDNLGEGDKPTDPNTPVYLAAGWHMLRVRFYESGVYEGIEFWWLPPGSGPSDIPYYGQTFHQGPITYNPDTNWRLVPPEVLFSPDSICVAMDFNEDHRVDYLDFAFLSQTWCAPPAIESGPPANDSTCNLGDVLTFASAWLCVW